MSLEFSKTQVIFLLDRSGSMRSMDAPGGVNRLTYAEQRLIGFLPEVLAHDPDGPSLHAFDDRVDLHPDVADIDAVKRIILACGPRGSTDTALAIQAAWDEHASKGNTETAVFLLTDGEPNSQQAVVDTIVGITKKMESPEAFRLMILTVGQRSTSLDAWLNGLDDNLGAAGAAFDIVGLGELTAFATLQDAGNALVASCTSNDEAGAQASYVGVHTAA